MPHHATNGFSIKRAIINLETYNKSDFSIEYDSLKSHIRIINIKLLDIL